jgi:hypothetical protein
MTARMSSSRSEPICTLAWADSGAGQSGWSTWTPEIYRSSRHFPSVRKWDTLSLRITVGPVQVIARREDYRGQNKCRPTQQS